MKIPNYGIKKKTQDQLHVAYLLHTYSLFTIDISTPAYFSLYRHWAEQPAPRRLY